MGGIGLRRGRRHPDELRIGDALDFWRVDAYEPPRLLRLRAEMRLPGRAWLEWRVEDGGAGSTVLEQRALYHPRGLWGRAYWLALLPFHAVIFGRLARALVAAAEAATSGAGPTSSPSPLDGGSQLEPTDVTISRGRWPGSAGPPGPLSASRLRPPFQQWLSPANASAMVAFVNVKRSLVPLRVRFTRKRIDPTICL